MNPLQQQLANFVSAYPGAEYRTLADNSTLVTVPNEALPPGWSMTASVVRFILPVGYPMARPDCFWADANLRIANGAMPQATNLQPIPHAGIPALWFSWHVQHWDPNRDSVTTYFQVIRARFREAK